MSPQPTHGAFTTVTSQALSGLCNVLVELLDLVHHARSMVIIQDLQDCVRLVVVPVFRYHPEIPITASRGPFGGRVHVSHLPTSLKILRRIPKPSNLSKHIYKGHADCFVEPRRPLERCSNSNCGPTPQIPSPC